MKLPEKIHIDLILISFNKIKDISILKIIGCTVYMRIGDLYSLFGYVIKRGTRKMKTAAIVIDKWKLPLFKKVLTDNGYKFSQHKGPGKGCLTLKVETEDVYVLSPIVKKANDEAARSKLN